MVLSRLSCNVRTVVEGSNRDGAFLAFCFLDVIPKIVPIMNSPSCVKARMRLLE